MKKVLVYSLCLGGSLAAITSQAIDLKQSKVTQVVNDVQIISAADQKQKAATVNDLFSMPDVLRTGAASRAELVAQDETVTRVGANTIFSFDPANRSIDLKQGSLLFHSPHGKGGGSIHTGSATASVLGTTLIVATTRNGGLKVIALEGEVEVKFLNGLKQKLDPGHMTFILPGANQLAPVIVFRLDELTQNSLLVKGFSQPLASLPLIQNQIDRQLKLIASGKASDTGLYAGDSATPDQVEVLDLNTISGQHPTHTTAVTPSPPPGPDLAAAERADATINQPSLTDSSLPTPPSHVYTLPFSIAGNSYFNGQQFSGFVARNIYVNTLSGGASHVLVDLSPYAGSGTFAMVAMDTFSIDGPVSFRGLGSDDRLHLIAGNQFALTPGISIDAAAKEFELASPATLLLNNINLLNSGKDLLLNSGADVAIENNSLVTTGSKLAINAINDISATDSHLVGDSAVLTSFDGSLTLDNSVLDAASHSLLFAPNFIVLNNSTINSDYVILNGLGTAAISLNNTTINAVDSIVAISAGDLNVTGTSTTPTLRSAKVLASGGSALNTSAASGSVVLNSMSGSVNITDTSITAHYLTVNSGDGILLDARGHSLIAAGSGSTATFTAPNLVTVNNADLTSYGTVNMAANTINLHNVAFRGVVNLRSALGIWYNGYMPGAVNDLGGVTYNGTLVNAANGSSGTLSGTGITVSGLH